MRSNNHLCLQLKARQSSIRFSLTLIMQSDHNHGALSNWFGLGQDSRMKHAYTYSTFCIAKLLSNNTCSSAQDQSKQSPELCVSKIENPCKGSSSQGKVCCLRVKAHCMSSFCRSSCLGVLSSSGQPCISSFACCNTFSMCPSSSFWVIATDPPLGPYSA